MEGTIIKRTLRISYSPSGRVLHNGKPYVPSGEIMELPVEVVGESIPLDEMKKVWRERTIKSLDEPFI